MPAVSKHPSSKSCRFCTSLTTDKYFACQSLDNQILIYAADGSFKQAKKKRFAGHTIAGYACNIGFSPDGKYISSGTGGGDVVFWDWKTGKIASRLRAHKEVVIDHAWLPNEHVSLIDDRLRRLELTLFSQRSLLLRGMVRSSCGHSAGTIREGYASVCILFLDWVAKHNVRAVPRMKDHRQGAPSRWEQIWLPELTDQITGRTHINQIHGAIAGSIK